MYPVPYAPLIYRDQRNYIYPYNFKTPIIGLMLLKQKEKVKYEKI